MSEKIERRPFHETVVEGIEKLPECSDMEFLNFLLQNTKIPNNHDAILSAYKKCCVFMGDIADLDVLDSIFEQKREAAAEAVEKSQVKIQALIRRSDWDDVQRGPCGSYSLYDNVIHFVEAFDTQDEAVAITIYGPKSE